MSGKWNKSKRKPKASSANYEGAQIIYRGIGGPCLGCREKTYSVKFLCAKCKVWSRIPYIRVCKWCSQTFRTTHKLRRYCTNECRTINRKVYATIQINSYNITVNEYRSLLRSQGAVCAICQESKRLVIDHDHETNTVRGLLCHRCNILVGYIEGPNVQTAQEYLARSLC